ncbi:unnamed protein product [Owenia fusiformis]|uniref:Ubiquitin carboxyl-terminal hydrolase n=1 Tax=Owenia fusiformis TaxID=6347 RepID=A0A8J1XGD8_OWEFU|nr:unnamed protein product [Owenia fusiformis]
MRVLETGTSQTVSMGKKKHKLRHGKKDIDLNSESSDEGLQATGQTCPHINKSVNLNAMKKSLKQQGAIGECVTCVKNASKGGAKPVMSPSDEDVGIIVCLQCGNQGCDRYSKERHAVQHYMQPRSTSHSLVINLNSWLIWCYDCDDEVNSGSSKRLLECVDFLRKALSSASTQQATQIPGKKAGIEGSEPSANEAVEAVAAKSATKQPNNSILPKVKGLSNLGNTCFFNAVMQNLSQTHILEQQLLQCSKDVKMTLPGREAIKCDDDDDVMLPKLMPMEIRLSDCVGLTMALRSFIHDMTSSSKNSTISPSTLFGQVCKKAPRFKGFQQQDSHELLRHLLDGMRAEEIKRIQGGILQEFQRPGITPKDFDKETKLKIKEYGRQGKHTFVDSVFGGNLISTVNCEECNTPSQVFEAFLDLSLPIVVEKPTRNNNGSHRKGIMGLEKTDELAGAIDGFSTNARQSKYQDKKSKKQAKRDSKKRRKNVKNLEMPAQPSIDDVEITDKVQETSSNGNKSPIISDADIEDNLDSDLSKNRFSNLDDSQISAQNQDKMTNPQTTSAQSPERKSPLVSQGSAGSSEDSNEVVVAISTTNGQIDEVHVEDVDKEHGSKTIEQSKDIKEITEKLQEVTIKQSNLENKNNTTKLLPANDDVIQNGVSNSNSGSTSGSDASNVVPCKMSGASSSLRIDAMLESMRPLGERYQTKSFECSVASCLNQFISAELLTGNNKFGCETCTGKRYKDQPESVKKERVYTNASKQLLLFSPPAVLTLHLKRFQQVGMRLRKVDAPVQFPLILDIAPFCSSLAQGVQPGQKKVLYSLYGVVEHSGRLSGGHYTAYVKMRQPNPRIKHFLQHTSINEINLEKIYTLIHQLSSIDGEQEDEQTIEPSSGKWYYVSDSSVRETNESAVLRCQAYILFYERIY